MAIRRRASAAGFALVENVLACAIIAVGLAGTFTINGQSMSVLRMAKDESFASQVLQQRIEHLRIANWQRISNATWIRDNLLNTAADGSTNLSNMTETVTIKPYNSSSTAVNKFTRTGTTATADAANTSMLNESAVTVIWSVTWKGIPKGRIHKRETLAMLGKGGVAK